jgi:chain length determinant protein (polysaccharide antigen chain regulator)
LPSKQPEAAAEFVEALIINAHEKAIANFSNDVSRVRNARIDRIKEQLNSLSLAAKQSREAAITRLQETNQQATAALQLQIDLKLKKARQDRENRIVQLQEALKTATQLGIDEPVTWDDLRPLRKSTQVVNELGNGDNTLPAYFRGTRLLEAELTQFKERQDDKPFVGGLTELERQVKEIQDDPKLAALKARVDDTIYVEQYDDLQRKLADLLEQPTEFTNAQMAVITQPAQVPSRSIRSPLLRFVLGIFLSGFIALIVAMIRIAVRNSQSRQADTPVTRS